MPDFTRQQKHEVAVREVAMRRRAYPRWVAMGKMTKEKAALETAIMEAIAADYAEPTLI